MTPPRKGSGSTSLAGQRTAIELQDLGSLFFGPIDQDRGKHKKNPFLPFWPLFFLSLFMSRRHEFHSS